MSKERKGSRAGKTGRMDKTDKKTSLPLIPEFTKAFTKDWERLSRSGIYDMRRLKAVMMLLIAGEGSLPPEWRDHRLTADWQGYRECHVSGDFLLIYEKNETTVVFVRTGTHTELFD